MADTVPFDKRKIIWSFIKHGLRREWHIGDLWFGIEWPTVGTIQTVMNFKYAGKDSPWGKGYVWKYDYHSFNDTWPQTKNEIVVKCIKHGFGK